MEASIVVTFEFWAWISLKAFSSLIILFGCRLTDVLQDKQTLHEGDETYRCNLVASFSAFFSALRMALGFFLSWVIST